MTPPPFDIETHVARHATALRALAVELVGDAATADDVVQQTWLGVLRHPPRHDAAIGGWLATVLRNVVRFGQRQQRRRVRREQVAALAVPAAVEDHATTLARGEVARQLIASVESLEPPLRDVIWQRFFEGRAPREIAAAKGEPIETVKSRLKRGLGMLRERLGARDGADWRAGFVAAFGLGREPMVVAATTASFAAGAMLMATWVKVAAGLAAALVGIAAFAWWPGDLTNAPSASPPNDGVAVPVVASEPIETPHAPREALADPVPTSPSSLAVTDPAVAGGRVRGRAVDEATRQPLADVLVRLTSGKVDRAASDPELRTGGDGAFEFAVRAEAKPGLELSCDDRAGVHWGGLQVPAAHTEEIGDVAMRRGRFVRGRLVLPSGATVPPDTFLTIEFTRQNDGRCRERFPVEARPDASGAFTTSSPVPFGPTTWRLSSFGEFELATPVQVVIDETEPAEVVLEAQRRAAIRGIVVDETGQPIAGVGVADHPTPMSRVKSAADGRFVLFRVRSGAEPLTAVFLAETPGCEPRPPIADVRWGTDDLRIVLQRTKPFAIEVVDGDGAPFEAFGVALQRPGLAVFAGGKVQQRGIHSGGQLAIDDVVRGSTAMRVVPTSAEWAPSEPIQLGAVEPVRIVLHRRTPLEVFVHADGEPVAGVHVQLLRERGGPVRNIAAAIEKDGVDSVWMHGTAIEAVSAGHTDVRGRVILRRDSDLSGCVLRTRCGTEPPGVVRGLVIPPAGELLRIELARHGAIAGRIDLRGRPRDTARIAIPGLGRTGGHAIDLGPDGAFEVRDVQSGAYRVALLLRTTSGRFVGAGERDVHVVRGSTATVAFDVDEHRLASVRGSVVATAGTLPSGLVVDFLRLGGGAGEVLASPAAAADGTFRCEDVSPGRYLLAFRVGDASNSLVPGFLPEPLVIAAGEEVRPRLRFAPRRLVVKLFRPDGSVVRGERVVARCAEATWPAFVVTTPVVDERVVLDPAPLLPVEFRAWNALDDWSTPVVMPPERSECEVTVVLPAPRR